MFRSWRMKLKVLLATVTLAVLLCWLYLFMGSLECEWDQLSFLMTQAAQPDMEREALASRVRRVEEENQQLRLQLSQAQAEGSDGSPQWGASAEDGDPPGADRSNRTACPKQRTVHKCEVGDGTSGA
uniref:Uncharacterized protein n=1 Tax=Melopsittacus undulatus TaxID=13146 RepID=A0A8V5FLM5_MELUD